MGYSNDESLRNDAEETLPLYEESHRADTSNLVVPDEKASPDEVRDFLVLVMLSRGVGIDHSRRVAARWTLGTGRELRSYPVAMYRDIFGPEDGWAVYKEVRVMYLTTEGRKTTGRRLFATLLALSLTLFATGVAVLNILSSDLYPLLEFAGVISCLFGFFGTVGFGVAVCVSFQKPADPQTQAENELKGEWYKAPAPQAPQIRTV